MTTEQAVLERAAAARGCDLDELVHWQVENPFFNKWSIWCVEMESLPPFPLYVAARDDQTTVIELDDGFRSLVESEPVALSSAQEAVAYMTFFVKAANPDMQVLASIDDIAGVHDDKEEQYNDIITPAKGEQTANGYSVTVHLLHEANLLRGRFDIDGHGAITSEFELLEKEISFFSAIE